MKSILFHPSLLRAALLAATITPTAVFAGTRTGTVHGPRGGVYQRSVSHEPGRLSVTGAATLPNGQSGSRSLTTERTPAGRTTTAQINGFDGRTGTYKSVRSRTDSGYVRDVTATSRNGGVATKHVEVSRQNGQVTRNVTSSATRPGS